MSASVEKVSLAFLILLLLNKRILVGIVNPEKGVNGGRRNWLLIAVLVTMDANQLSSGLMSLLIMLDELVLEYRPVLDVCRLIHARVNSALCTHLRCFCIGLSEQVLCFDFWNIATVSRDLLLGLLSLYCVLFNS